MMKALFNIEADAREYLETFDPYFAIACIRKYGAIPWWNTVHEIQLAALTLDGGQNVL